MPGMSLSRINMGLPSHTLPPKKLSGLCQTSQILKLYPWHLGLPKATMIDQHTKSPLVVETESGWEKSPVEKIDLPLPTYAPWGLRVSSPRRLSRFHDDRHPE